MLVNFFLVRFIFKDKFKRNFLYILRGERSFLLKKERKKESDGSKVVLRCPLCALLDIKGGHGGMLEGSQDKRIRKPKLEKGKERKLKRNETKKENKFNFIVNIEESVREP